MPLVKIEILKGKPLPYKRELLQAVHEALVTALGIEDDDRFQRLYELEDNNFERRASKTDRFTMIELTLLPGRSAGLKSTVIKEITAALGRKPGIAPSDIIIIIKEPPLENWGCYGKQASELAMNYRLGE